MKKYALHIAGKKHYEFEFVDDETAIKKLEKTRFNYGGESKPMELAKDIANTVGIVGKAVWNVIKIWPKVH